MAEDRPRSDDAGGACLDQAPGDAGSITDNIEPVDLRAEVSAESYPVGEEFDLDSIQECVVGVHAGSQMVKAG